MRVLSPLTPRRAVVGSDAVPSLMTRAREWWAKATSRAGLTVLARAVPTWKAGRPLPLPGPDTIPTLVQEALRSNAIVDACVDELCEAIQLVEMVPKTRAAQVGQAAQPLGSQHPLTQLLQMPTPELDGAAFRVRQVLNQLVAGQHYTHKVRGTGGLPVELWPLRPDRVRVVPASDQDRAGLVGSYLVLPEGTTVASGTPVAPADIIHHVYKPDYLDEFQAASPLQAAWRWIRIDNAAAEYLEAFFENSGVPAGLLIFKRQVEREDRARVRELWRETYGRRADGSTGWHDIGVLDSDVSYEETGSRPGSKLAIEPIFDQTEARICAAFGVPPIMVGVRLGFAYQLSYASYVEARLSFWHETVMPMAAGIAASLTRGLCTRTEFGTDLVIEPDYAGVAALGEDLESKRAWALSGWTTGLYTRDEALVRAGEPPVGGDKGGEYRLSGLTAGDLDPGTEGFARRLSLTPREIQIARRAAEQTYRDLMRRHWRAQSAALRAELEEEIAASR